MREGVDLVVRGLSICKLLTGALLRIQIEISWSRPSRPCRMVILCALASNRKGEAGRSAPDV